MVTEREIMDAIRECEAEPITAQKRSALADLYIIYDHLFGEPVEGYSYSPPPTASERNIIEVSPDSAFLEVVNGKDAEKVLAVLDELMETTKTLHPRMYNKVLEKLSDL